MSWEEKEVSWKDKQEEDFALLNDNGWIIECESPFEISTKDGSFASGEAARIVLSNLKYEHHYKHTEPDMRDCFNAGVNRGVTVAAIITGRDIGEEFPRYDEYMKKYEEK